MNKAYLGYSFMLLSAASFALTSLLSIMSYDTMSVPSAMLIQSVAAQAILGAMLWRERRGAAATPARPPLGASRLELAVFALSGGGATVAMFFAFAHLSLSLGTVLLFTYPAFVTLLAWAVLGQRPGRRHLFVLVLTLTGALLTTNLQSGSAAGVSLLGVGLALLAAAFHGLFIVMGERVASAISAVAATALTRAVILAAALLLSASVWAELPRIPGEGWLIALLSAVVGGVAPFLFLQRGITLIGANRAAIVSVVELPIALMLGWLVRGDLILSAQWVGTVLIGTAVLISQWE